MAYTFFPTSTAQIVKECASKPDNAAEIVGLFQYLSKKFKQVKTPVNIDVKKLGVVNVTRELQGTIDINTIKKDLKLKDIKIKFGAGSAGNRGVKNRGNLFENTFANAVRDYWDEDKESNDTQIRNAVVQLAKIYKFDKLKNLFVAEEGAANTRRPLIFNPGPYISSPTGNLNIGSIVTDLTLHNAKKESEKSKSNVIGFLSLKLGNTTTFFNIGVKTILTKQEIQTGKIKNRHGLALLKMFGINNADFCNIFNFKLKKGRVENTLSKADRPQLQKFLQSGIGFGYTVIHKLSSGIKIINIDRQYMNKAATPQSLQVFYGGKTGTGKRIDMEIRTQKYLLKLNIRDTQGTDGYPTRIMGDFSYL